MAERTLSLSRPYSKEADEGTRSSRSRSSGEQNWFNTHLWRRRLESADNRIDAYLSREEERALSALSPDTPHEPDSTTRVTPVSHEMSQILPRLARDILVMVGHQKKG